jgi:3-oxoacyl-[acyl-carrier protein] reductase
VTAAAPSALITGGSRGIGFGVARRLAELGWNVTLSARNVGQLAAIQAELAAFGGTVEVVAGDMADEACVEALVDRHRSAFGALNALILAAGVGTAGPLDGYPAPRLDKQLTVNFRSPFLLVGQALPLLHAGVDADPARGGRVVALASIEGVYPDDRLAAYAATKAALISLVRSINVEEGARGIAATAISPAFVDTDMSAWVTDRIPARSMIAVADVVKVVELLLSLSPAAVIPHVVMNRIGSDPYRA